MPTLPATHFAPSVRVAIVAIALSVSVAPAFAQDSGGIFGGGIFGGSKKSKQQAQNTVRIDQMEAQIRSMTGQIQELAHEVRTLRERIRRMQEDNDYRFQELEGAAPARKRSSAEPPETRGTIAANNGDDPARQPQILGTVPANEPAGSAAGGPLDLSALARGDIGPSNTLPGVSTPSEPQIARVTPVSPRDAYDRAYGMILSGDYRGAEIEFRGFLDAYPDHRLAGNAQYWVGESLYARRDFRAAADAFLKSYTAYPDGRKAPDSLLKLGLSLSGLKEPRAACATYSELLTKYPNAPRTIRKRARAEQKRGQC